MKSYVKKLGFTKFAIRILTIGSLVSFAWYLTMIMLYLGGTPALDTTANIAACVEHYTLAQCMTILLSIFADAVMRF